MIQSVPEPTSAVLSIGQGVRDRSGAKATADLSDVQEKKSSLQLSSASKDRIGAVGAEGASEIQDALDTQGVLGNQDLKERVAQIQDTLNQIDSHVQFSVEEESDRVVIKVVERESGEVIRQIPSEEVLRAQRFFDEHSGILLEEEA
ncbi:flagellar protein FlaG [Nitrospira sp. M1]